jgi:hypothetical protein
MRKKIYLKLIELLTEDELIKHVDLWNENIQFIEQEQLFALPAVFVEFEPIMYLPFPHGAQEATATVRLHIVAEGYNPTSAQSQYLNEALQYLDLLDSVNARIHGFSGDGFNTFTRQQSITNHNHGEIIESIETFSVHLIDESTAVEQQTTPKPTVKIKF